jgi:hypothetical protein
MRLLHWLGLDAEEGVRRRRTPTVQTFSGQLNELHRGQDRRHLLACVCIAHGAKP